MQSWASLRLLYQPKDMHQESSQCLLCKSFPTCGSKHSQVRRGGTPRTGPAEGDVSRLGSWWDVALMAVGLERASSGGTSTAKLRQLLAGEGKGGTPPGERLCPHSLLLLSGSGRQERVPKGQRIGLLHLLDKEERNLTRNFNEIHVEVWREGWQGPDRKEVSPLRERNVEEQG